MYAEFKKQHNEYFKKDDDESPMEQPIDMGF
jgi:hypothetical protein